MLTIEVPETEFYDEINGRFSRIKHQTLSLEHSLVSISKWESKWCKSFINNSKKLTDEEAIDYIRCMTLTKNINPKVYDCIPMIEIEKVVKYIGSPMTATIIYEPNDGSGGREPVTSELIYYWMVAQQIPFECEKWPLNRLLTLIKICSIKNQPKKKMSAQAIGTRNKAINEARKKALGTTG